MTTARCLSRQHTARAARTVLGIAKHHHRTGLASAAGMTGAANTGYAGLLSNTSTGGYAVYANGIMGASLVTGQQRLAAEPLP